MKPLINIPPELLIRLAMNDRRTKFIYSDAESCYKDMLYVDPDIGKLFKQADPQEELIVVHDPQTEFNDSIYAVVWMKDAWRQSYARLLKQRELSELDRKSDALRREIIEYLAKMIRVVTGLDAVPDGESHIYSMAESIVEKRLLANALFYLHGDAQHQEEQRTWLTNKLALLPEKKTHVYVGGYHSMYVKEKINNETK